MKISKNPKSEVYEFDSLKIDFINKFIDLSKGSQLVFTVSPIWYGMDTAELQPIIDLCKSRNIRLIDFSNDPKYVHNDIYFNDGTHLNARGADEFTRDLIKVLRKESIIE